MIVGIDPGLGGAIAFLHPVQGFHCVEDMPTVVKPVGKGSMVDARTLGRLLRHPAISGAMVEAIYMTPPLRRGKDGAAVRTGSSSAFSFGDSVGCVRAVLAVLEIPVIYIHAARWKRTVGLVGKPKDASRALAMERFPAAAGYLARKKDGGRAEAILIASLHPEMAQGRPVEGLF